jgi:hypothetical protein
VTSHENQYILKLLTQATDTHLLPPEVDAIFRRVQDSAHYMPDWQMEVSVTCTFKLKLT